MVIVILPLAERIPLTLTCKVAWPGATVSQVACTSSANAGPRAHSAAIRPASAAICLLGFKCRPSGPGRRYSLFSRDKGDRPSEGPGGRMPGGQREVAVFRHNLFRISETFITQQAGALGRYRPLYVGRLRQGAGPAGAESRVLGDLGGVWKWPRIGWQMLSRGPGPYLRLLADRPPALIHAHFGVEGVYALPVAKRLGIPLITTFHGFDATLSTAALLSSPAWANYPLFRGRLARQ